MDNSQLSTPNAQLKELTAVMARLDAFLEQADARKALIKSTGDVDAALNTAVGQLRESVARQIASIRETSVRLDAVMKDMMQGLTASMREQLQQLQATEHAVQKLNQLDKLADVVAALAEMKKIQLTQNNQINWEVANLTEIVTKAQKQAQQPAAPGLGVKGWQVKLFMFIVGLCAVVSTLVVLYKWLS